ncbi:hypothetical protein BGZ46_009734 [Entomortierella lignicola]|nr:hypothetical protein BGZ46_009734 [Entomortierella lignicola]
MISLHTTVALAAILIATAKAATPTTSYLPQSSPTWLPSFPAPSGVITSWPPASTAAADLPSGALPTFTPITGYPEMGVPVANASSDPNVIAVYNVINWNMVPNAPVTANITSGPSGDPYCWCYVPPDIYFCPTPYTWGLTYDDGPMYYYPFTAENTPWAEPNLYDYLLNHNNQKANLFYIGYKLIGATSAAQRGLNDGHTICVHTWSHPHMTTLDNYQVIAEFYYSLRVIKEVLGITPKCWRPPYGDVDDRIRSIAWQMGLRTIIWDLDTNDWQIYSDSQGPAAPDPISYTTANDTVAGWMANRENGNDTAHGHITLEHELSNSTITLAEFWLPTIQTLYKTIPATACNNIAQPYWEENFIYPIQGDVAYSTNGTATPNVKAPSYGNFTNSTSTSTSGSSTSPNAKGNSGSSSFQALTASTLVLIAAGIAFAI